jgi:hypothetical protein
MTRRLLLLAAALPSFGFCQKISLSFDAQQDFAAYKTFAIASGKVNSRNPVLNNELVEKQIENDIRQRLTARGLTEVTSNPDLNVRYSLGSSRQVETDAYPAGWYGTRIVRRGVTEGTLIFDLRDAKRHVLVWRAIAVADDANAMKIKDRLDAMVRKAAGKYPPKN